MWGYCGGLPIGYRVNLYGVAGLVFALAGEWLVSGAGG